MTHKIYEVEKRATYTCECGDNKARHTPQKGRVNAALGLENLGAELEIKRFIKHALAPQRGWESFFKTSRVFTGVYKLPAGEYPPFSLQAQTQTHRAAGATFSLWLAGHVYRDT